MFSAKTRWAKGMNCSAMRRSTTRGSEEASTFANSITNAGGSMRSIASVKSARFDGTWRRTAAGVTFSSPAMSASVAASNPFAAKIFRAAARSWARLMVGGRPICK